MRLIIPPVYERMKEEGFDSTSLDVFKRSSFANILTNLFRGTDSGLVLTVNSQWGDGKTSFIKIWEKDLEVDGQFIPIYYDAVSNDFQSMFFCQSLLRYIVVLKRKLLRLVEILEMMSNLKS